MPEATKVTATKKGNSSVGAPAQHRQPSRKGKKAWRKNVDLDGVEEALEGMRAEERETGTTLQKMADDQLFTIDTTGDEKGVDIYFHFIQLSIISSARHILPKNKFSFSDLKSTQILRQRSAVPAVHSRKRSAVSQEDRERLNRIAKRPRKGPFNAIIDTSEAGQGSAIVGVSDAVKASGTYDPWAAASSSKSIREDAFGSEGLPAPPPKAPHHSNPKDSISLSAVPEPHLGTSYNPPVAAHNELLQEACEEEERRTREKDRYGYAEVKKKMDNARVDVTEDGVAPGMRVDIPAAEDGQRSEADEGDEGATVKSMPDRRTRKMKARAEKALAEKRLVAAKKERKKLFESIDNIKTLRRQSDRDVSSRQKTLLEKKALLQAKIRRGLGGKKLGKHKVPEQEIDVQLGEDLTESLRGLKVTFLFIFNPGNFGSDFVYSLKEIYSKTDSKTFNRGL
jgi:nucleolar protein 53